MAGSIDALYSSASAMTALGQGMAATAHNVANVNTAGFQPQRVTYETGPAGQGVQAQPVVQRPEQIISGSPAYPSGNMDPSLPPEMINPSNTELAREFTNMISLQRAYEANAAVIRTADVMQGVIVDLKV